MPISQINITTDQTKKIISTDEGHFIDLKAIDISPSKLTRSISAFANADGGELFIGIDEITRTGVRTWRGFNKSEDANGHIQVFEALFPLGHGFIYSFLTAKGSPGAVLHVEILKAQEIIYANDGIAYLRRVRYSPMSRPLAGQFKMVAAAMALPCR